MSHEPCSKNTRVWSLQKAECAGQWPVFLPCSGKGQLKLLGVPQGIGQEPKVMMTRAQNEISAQDGKKSLSRENYLRVEKTALKGSEFIVI